jgi:hypothetical protein
MIGRRRGGCTKPEDVAMDVLYFLKERTKFIRQYYETAAEPFREIMRKIEAEEPPFVPEYSEDGEPPFLEEWVQANTSLEILGRGCLSMLLASLKLYFQTWESELHIIWEDGAEKKKILQGWVCSRVSADLWRNPDDVG